MFFSLLIKECKELLKSITYYIFLVCIILFFITQMGTFEGVFKPLPNQESYGTKYSDDELVIMSETIQTLTFEFESNSYTTYPIGFYKEVQLSDLESEKVKEILESVTDENASITFLEFKDYMAEIDKLLGGGSYYNPKILHKNAKITKTYKDALFEYESILKDDQISRAHARLFSDYMGIILGFLPVFLAVTRCLKDKRAKADQVIFAKECSAFTIILSRYIAMVFMILIPLFLISITPTLQSIYCAYSNGITADSFAFVKVILGWLLPSVLVTLSVGFFLTELTSGPVAIFIQGLWWFISIFLGASNLVGTVGFNLIPRFNTIGAYSIYQNIFHELVINRIFYSVFGIILILLTVCIFDFKRRGNLHGTIFKNRKRSF